MSNFLAVISQCNPGEEVLVGDISHLGRYEQGNISRFGGIPFRAIPTQTDGSLSFEDIQKFGYFSNDDFHMSHTTLVSLENTHNYLGGIPLDLKYLENLAKLKKDLGFRVHTDGARLINASIGLEKPLRDLCQFSDTVSMCFTKGLGCPFGAVLIGPEEVIGRARRARKAIGGQWRQGGVAAVACLHSIQNLDPIKNDHQMAKKWARLIAEKCPEVIVKHPKTNIVLIKCESENIAEKIIQEMEKGELSVKLQFGASSDTIRAVFHRSADYSLIEDSVSKLENIFSKI